MFDTRPYVAFAAQTLGYTFTDITFLLTAFTHRSYVNEHKKTVKEHNERLEFLGDAVLELVVTEYLYTEYDEPEGILTNWRSALVRTESIGDAAARLGFEELLRLSRGEKRGSDRARAQILANTYEAVIGAMYLDGGIEPVKAFIHASVISTLPSILESGSWMDAKSFLQETSQSVDGYTPVYRVLNEEGPDHEKIFTVGVFVGEKLRGQGIGPSKQTAQQKAAAEALAYYKALQQNANIDNQIDKS
jgi:ribonuclease III